MSVEIQKPPSKEITLHTLNVAKQKGDLNILNLA